MDSYETDFGNQYFFTCPAQKSNIERVYDSLPGTDYLQI